MGLDMYLKASRYIFAYEFSSDEDKRKYRDIIADFEAEELADKDTPTATVSITVAYWRKANAIHRWFVDNVQDGVDDCKNYYVSRENLEELRETCRKVLSSIELAPGKINAGKISNDGGEWETIWQDGGVVTAPGLAEELLPTTSGFFFGGTDYDEWYVNDLKRTIDQIDRVLVAGSEWEFEYHSSW